jgi:hypothetical protein
MDFDEPPEAKSARDRSGHGRDMVFHGTQSVEGRGGRARRFDGKSDYVDLPRRAAPRPARTPITVSAWIQPSKPDGVILAHGGDRHGYVLHLKGGRLAFSVSIDWKRSTVLSAEPLPEGWVHVAGQLRAGGQMALFVQGKQAGTGKARSLMASNPGDSLQVGADTIKPVGPYEVNAHFGGIIDEVKVVFGDVKPAAIAREAEGR